ncbi:MAG TPA: dTDP-glucose 4,6-dehydratase [archaeon]|nr:dTDP-glucose 4,6-dehydratase [archaeon]
MAKDQKLFITGGCGFIGSNFIRFIIKNTNYEIINYDALTYAGNEENLQDIKDSSRYFFIKGNICDKNLVIESLEGCDIIVNFAAESHVDKSINCCDDFFATNILGTATLLGASKELRIKRFLQISTDEVYGSLTKQDGSSKEKDLLSPSSPYSSSKASADLISLSYYKTYGLPVLITRSSNNYGPFQNNEKVIPKFITNLLRGEKVPLMGKGENIRDWLYVEDNCAAILTVMEKGKDGEIYNIGGENEKTNLEITKIILAGLEKDESWINEVPHRLGHDFRYSVDCYKIKKLGWEQNFSFEEGMEKTINWYKENRSWWKN